MTYRVRAERTIETCRYTTEFYVEIDKPFESLRDAFQCIFDYMCGFSEDWYYAWREYSKKGYIYFARTYFVTNREFVDVSIEEE